MTEMKPLTDTIRAQLQQVSTATISTQLRRRGLGDCFLEGLRPSRSDLRLLGIARTLRYVAHRADVFARQPAAYNEQKRVIDTIRHGEVLIIEARGQLGAGTIGDILALRVQQCGGVGIITDGCLRDSPSFADLGIPTYSAGAHAAPLGRRHVPLDSDLPISCAGVLILPGDVLVGDAEGVIVIPASVLDEVAHDALEEEMEEKYILERVREGAAIEGLYPLGANHRPDYDHWRAEHDTDA